MNLEAKQREVCERYGSVFVASDAHLTVGIAENAKQDLMPLNGLRHPPEHGTTGWFIWRGEELSQSPDFFVHSASRTLRPGAQKRYRSLVWRQGGGF